MQWIAGNYNLIFLLIDLGAYLEQIVAFPSKTSETVFCVKQDIKVAFEEITFEADNFRSL